MSSHYRHRSKGGILTIPLTPSKVDHAAGNLHFALGTPFQLEVGEIEDCAIDVIKANMAQLLRVGSTHINYGTFRGTVVLWRDVFAWRGRRRLVARLGAWPGTTLLRPTAMTIAFFLAVAQAYEVKPCDFSNGNPQRYPQNLNFGAYSSLYTRLVQVRYLHLPSTPRLLLTCPLRAYYIA